MAEAAAASWAELTDEGQDRALASLRAAIDVDGLRSLLLSVVSRETVTADGQGDAVEYVQVSGEVKLDQAEALAAMKESALLRVADLRWAASACLSVGDRATDQEACLLKNGRPARLLPPGAADEGRVIALLFWRALPEAAAGSAALAAFSILRKRCKAWAESVSFIAVSVDDDRDAAVAAARKATASAADRPGSAHAPPLCHRWAPGFDSALAQLFGITTAPELLLLDQRRELVWKGHPAELNIAAAIEAVIEMGGEDDEDGEEEEEEEEEEAGAGEEGVEGEEEDGEAVVVSGEGEEAKEEEGDGLIARPWAAFESEEAAEFLSASVSLLSSAGNDTVKLVSWRSALWSAEEGEAVDGHLVFAAVADDEGEKDLLPITSFLQATVEDIDLRFTSVEDAAAAAAAAAVGGGGGGGSASAVAAAIDEDDVAIDLTT